jgi:type 1 glutamine amidotransferase
MRGRRAVFAGLLMVALSSSAAQAAERRAFLITEARGFVHPSVPTAANFFMALGERSRRIDVVHLQRGAEQLTPRRLGRADGVIFANTSGELPLPDRPALRRFVRRGGALIGTHSASDMFHSWPAFETLLGGEFAHHGALQQGRLLIEQRNSITRGLPSSFRLTDEFYEFASPVPPGTTVLVRLDPDSVPDEMGTDLPLAWTRRYGRGRVFYDALGHPPETWQDPVNGRLLARGVAWALASRK